MIDALEILNLLPGKLYEEEYEYKYNAVSALNKKEKFSMKNRIRLYLADNKKIQRLIVFSRLEVFPSSKMHAWTVAVSPRISGVMSRGVGRTIMRDITRYLLPPYDNIEMVHNFDESVPLLPSGVIPVKTDIDTAINMMLLSENAVDYTKISQLSIRERQDKLLLLDGLKPLVEHLRVDINLPRIIPGGIGDYWASTLYNIASVILQRIEPFITIETMTLRKHDSFYDLVITLPLINTTEALYMLSTIFNIRHHLWRIISDRLDSPTRIDWDISLYDSEAYMRMAETMSDLLFNTSPYTPGGMTLKYIFESSMRQDENGVKYIDIPRLMRKLEFYKKNIKPGGKSFLFTIDFKSDNGRMLEITITPILRNTTVMIRLYRRINSYGETLYWKPIENYRRILMKDKDGIRATRSIIFADSYLEFENAITNLDRVIDQTDRLRYTYMLGNIGAPYLVIIPMDSEKPIKMRMRPLLSPIINGKDEYVFYFEKTFTLRKGEALILVDIIRLFDELSRNNREIRKILRLIRGIIYRWFY